MMALMLMTLVGLLVVSVLILVQLMEIARNTRGLGQEIKELRLTSRTRVRQAGVQSGPVSDEQVLSRLGRVSVGRRVVVGGEDGSEQKTKMKRGIKVGRTGGEDVDE